MNDTMTPETVWQDVRRQINMAALAQHLNLVRATVAAWKKVPAERVIVVAEYLKVPPQRLRPDLYAPATPKDPWTVL